MAIHALGPFRLDTQAHLLLRDSAPVALGRRAIALLQILVERPGTLVSKDALLEAAWPGRAVEESNLPAQIAALRRVLGEAQDGERWIETMPGRGYRFIGPVRAEAGTAVVSLPLQIDAEQDPAPTLHDDAERRQITAMSCELVGVTAAADGFGLEDVREAIGAFQRCVAETIDRYDGFVVSRLGNTELVLFGYPAAHEHDAEKAVRAGLELCAAVRTLRPGADVPMRCRVGIATGMAIIGNLSRDGTLQDREIVGEAPTLATRLQLSVKPDITAIDPATRHLIGNLFDYQDLGTIDPTNGAEPLRIWRVLGQSAIASRFEALRGSELTPMIGRDEEIDLLLRRWARAKAGNGQVVLVSGEPGIGKSRLAAAFADCLRAEPHLRLRYFCSPYHQNSALYPFIDQLGRAAGFTRDDPPEVRLEKLETLLLRAMPSDKDVALLADLLSLPTADRYPPPNLSPQRKKEQTLEALIRQLEGLARQQPVIMVFEDAYWIDPTSRELLDLTVDRVRGLPVLVIVTFRPEFQPPWTGQSQVTMLALNRLDRHDRTALVAQLAGGKTLPNEVVVQIAERTDGVPLFVEELTKSVLESDLLREETDHFALDGTLQPFAIPTSLQDSLMARLDRLASVRPVAQIGAAIGREFPYRLVRAVSRLREDELQAALSRLVASELVLQRGTPPDAIYSFKHALVQDAAHSSLLRSSRQQLHARIAEALGTQTPELMETQPELFAQHYAEAGLLEKSVTYWGKAGQRSAARSAMAEAVVQLHKGLDQLALLPNAPERQGRELEFWSALGAVLQAVKGQAAPETGHAYARARELWDQLGSPSEFLHIPYGQSLHHVFRGELDLAQCLDEDLLRLSRQRNDSTGLILGHISSGQTLLFAGGFASSRSHFEEALALYDPTLCRSLARHAGPHPQVSALGYLGIDLLCLGYPHQALVQSRAAIAKARGLAHPPSLAASLALGTLLLLLSGDNTALDERAGQLVAVATEQGFPRWHAQGTICRGWVKVKNGDVVEGISLLRSGSKAYSATGSVSWMPHYLALLARASAIAGQIEEDLALFDDALELVRRTGERLLEAELNRHKGRLLLRLHPVAAEQFYCRALSIAREQEAKLWELRAVVSLARLWHGQGRHAEARDLLAPVYSWFTEGFDTLDLKEAKALLAELA